MTDQRVLRVEIDGGAVSDEQFRYLALHSYGHFTAMQVRAGAVRGLDLHLARLNTANQDMFGAELDPDLIRAHIRHALGDLADASVRTHVVLSEGDVPVVLVTVRPPAGMSGAPQRLRSVPYQRPLPHIKQVGGGFGQVYYRRLAQHDGCAEVLLTGPDGVIAEGGVTNVGFFDGSGVVWPDAPALMGITMRLLERGMPSRRDTVRLADLPTFEGVFVANSRGIAPVERVDELRIPVAVDRMKAVDEVYEAVPWDRI
ncbi:MAG TPA: aminotransferase class IV [Pseudonocardiaceae bacterium]|nr:aminotransferase class IV [Pseudonocardiaceae bacterium]